MSALQHEMILASAGSGKTHALTNRFVALLARGAAPERIVALTFTRKAAGEFFDEILQKLAAAARHPEAAVKLAREIEQPKLQSGDFLRMLRTVVNAMHRLRLGTLDGFFARIVRAFPLELGLAGEFQLLEEHAAQFERRRVLQRIFARAGAGALTEAQQEFVEAFKRATFGAEEKRLGARLDAFLDDHQERYLVAPHAVCWGNHERIWPQGSVWLSSMGDAAPAIAALQEALRSREVDGVQRARWEAFFTALAEWVPGMPVARPMEYILKNALDVWPSIRAGHAEMIVARRKFTIAGAAAAALVRVVTHVVGGELRRHLATTRGIHAVLRGYETVYRDLVRRAGKLTFADVQRLLVPDAGVPMLAQDRADEDAENARLLIDYRLDGEIDHWLFDEFQDTSRGQWQVLRNLVDEALQDASGARSFFCVGDVKQAIYTWREGDHRLLREIFDHYNRSKPGKIAERHLVQSWRSGPAPIEMVNAVFGNATVLQTLFPGEASEAWTREWRTHQSAVSQRTGQAALLHAEDEGGRWTVVLRLLQEIQPIERGLSCAVLVQKNETGRDLADFLRREGDLPAIAESDLHVCTDNPLGAALLALVQAAAHPGDSLAWEHVQMTPLRGVLTTEGIETLETLSAFVFRQVHESGFERTVEFWLRRLEPGFAAHDVFSRERARQIAAAAAAFDETGSRDFSEFVEFMARHTVRDVETPAAIRVMTIHKAKGLGFDVVLLPDLEGKKLAQAREGLAVHKAEDRSVEWVLSLPSKLFWKEDEVLASHVRVAEAEACYEKLALLYVAMTRAKRAMYLIASPVGTSESQNYPRLLGDALGRDAGPLRVGELDFHGSWTAGDSSWFEAVSIPAVDSPEGSTPGIPALERASASMLWVARGVAYQPSEKNGVLPAAQLFTSGRYEAADFGSAVHALLAQVEWGDEIEEFSREQKNPTSSHDEPLMEALACLRSPELRSVWARPAGEFASEVWRERAFEIVLDGAWITGIFDRVVIARDAGGRAVRATVFDFKTDHVANDKSVALLRQRYAAQLEIYRRAASILAGVRPQNVEAKLVLTRLRQLVPMPASGS
jgi:ATP-dependent helicase/nuclease subunit A